MLFSARKKNRKIPEPIFRLLQNSRRVPPSAYASQRGGSFLLSFARSLERVWSALVSRRRKKRDVYEKLANTIDELEEGTQMTDEELSALKNRIQNQAEARKNHQEK